MTSRRHLANAIRALSMDAVQKANSGHPGMPMGMADIAQVLWQDFLKHNPKNPAWVNRDRFVLSNGHGSMLLYSLLHLTGYDLSLQELENFRQLHSKTPGHPEHGLTPGVETTTGPLGQGLANAVGMAIAERTLAKEFNKPEHTVIDHHTYVFVGDGCLMEGISHEACSLAGTLGLSKLIILWDDNGISIDGEVVSWFNDDTAKRFEAYGFQVIQGVDGHDANSIEKAIMAAKAETNKPSLICCRTVIGFGAPTLAGSEKSHGSPLGADEIAKTKAALNWSYEPFVIPEDVRQQWDATEKGAHLELAWNKTFEAYQKAYPELAAELQRRLNNQLSEGFKAFYEGHLKALSSSTKSYATRKASLLALDALSEVIPEMLGGSADLTGSNLTYHKNSKAITHEEHAGNYLHYGVREFGMGAIMNGIALHGGFIPYGGTFLTFLDYMRNSVRMAALMHQRAIFVFTHDSIGLGEDGPTHQPVEHLAMLRATPFVQNWRPCDNTETFVAWGESVQYQGPSTLILSRQELKEQTRDQNQLEAIAKGGYVLKSSTTQRPDLVILATGSEVELAMAASEQLAAEGIKANVVSMPCVERFVAASQAYQESVLPTGVKRLAIEAASSAPWHRFVGFDGQIIGLDRFGESAPAKELFQFFGFSVENVVQVAKDMLVKH